MRRLVVTADDFGAAPEVNEAIERAHTEGILTTASLMVAAPAAADAVARARRLSTLHVGLHLVLVAGRPLLPARDLPDLTDAAGQFRRDLVGAGFRFFFRPAVRRQLRAEIRAQLDAFRATGLPLDHVNGHCHMHLHPTVLGLVLEIGRDYGLRAVRLPVEPLVAAWRARGGDLAARVGMAAVMRPWAALMRARCRRAGVMCNDHLFGLHDTGAMDRDTVLRLLAHLPRGVSEIYFHPATAPWPGMDPGMRGYRLADELAALTDPTVAEAIAARGIQRTTFTELAAGGGAAPQERWDRDGGAA